MKKTCFITVFVMFCALFAGQVFAAELLEACPIGTINVRAAPSLNSKVVASLAESSGWVMLVDANPVYNRSDGRQWYRVRFYYQADRRGNRRGAMHSVNGQWFVSERVIYFL